MRKHLALILFAVVASGCVTMPTEEDWRDARIQWVDANREDLTSEQAAAIVEGRVLLGMTIPMAEAAWTHWTRVDANRTTTAQGSRTQHVFRQTVYTNTYRWRYVYTEGGVIVAIQD